MKPKEFEYLVDALKSLPSISLKSANKIAYYLLKSDEKYYNDFISRIIDAKTNIKQCMFCNNLVSNSYSCDICRNIERRNRHMCIVTTVDDLYKIESSESFYGIYYVLENELDYKNKESLNNINFEKLMNTINKFNINEILLATNLTPNGELTASYIRKYLVEQNLNIEFYRLATGIPLNSSIDYIDWESLKFSIKNKTKI